MRAPVEVGALGHGVVVSKRVDGGLRPVFGNHTRRVTGFGENRDRTHGQVFGSVSDGFAYRFGDGQAVTVAAAELRELSHFVLRLDYRACHHGYRLARIAAAGSFRTQHDRMTSIEDGFRYVAGFSTRGPWIPS